MSKTHQKTLWNIFHPDLETSSRGNKIIAQIIQKNCDVTFIDHYKEYPDFNIDVAKQQKLLINHELIVFQFPFYWYSTPALMKQWMDKVLTYGFAYPPKEGKELHGKAMMCVITTGGPQFSYQSGEFNNFTLSELLRPLQQSAILCGMKWLSPHVINGVLPGDSDGIQATSDQDITAFAGETAKFVNSYDIKSEHSLKAINSPYFS